MPTLTETPPLPYELLFRWDEVTGNLKGAHFCTITTVLRDGVPIAATPSDPMPIALAQGASGLDLSTILGTLTVSQQARIEELEAKCARLQILVGAFPTTEPGGNGTDSGVNATGSAAGPAPTP